MTVSLMSSPVLSLGQIFLLVDLQVFFFRFRVEGTKKEKEKSSENDQLTFRAFSFLIFSELFFSPETVKLVIGKPTVCIKSLNILSFS